MMEKIKKMKKIEKKSSGNKNNADDNGPEAGFTVNSAIERISRMLKKGVIKFFGLEPRKISKIVISEEIYLALNEFCSQTHPKEFLIFYKADYDRKQKSLKVKELLFQAFDNSEVSASVVWLGGSPVSDSTGTIHSHPRGAVRPSGADLHFYNKHPGIHIIIGYPYTKDRFKAFNMKAEEIKIEFSN